MPADANFRGGIGDIGERKTAVQGMPSLRRDHGMSTLQRRIEAAKAAWRGVIGAQPLAITGAAPIESDKVVQPAGAAMPTADATRPTESEDRSHLLAAYAIERQDDASASTVAFAITATGLTYVIGAAAYFRDNCTSDRCTKVPSWLPLVAPAVAVAFVGFLVLNVAATRMRSVHILRLEYAIRMGLPGGHEEPSFHSDAGLVHRPDEPFENPRIRLVFAAITIVSYGTIMLALLAFTGYILFAASGRWSTPKYIVARVYGVVEILEIVGFVWPLSHPRFVYRHPSQDGLPH